MEALTNDPDRDVTTIKSDLCLSALNSGYAKVMANMYGIIHLVRTHNFPKN